MRLRRRGLTLLILNLTLLWQNKKRVLIDHGETAFLCPLPLVRLGAHLHDVYPGCDELVFFVAPVPHCLMAAVEPSTEGLPPHGVLVERVDFQLYLGEVWHLYGDAQQGLESLVNRARRGKPS